MAESFVVEWVLADQYLLHAIDTGGIHARSDAGDALVGQDFREAAATDSPHIGAPRCPGGFHDACLPEGAQSMNTDVGYARAFVLSQSDARHGQ